MHMHVNTKRLTVSAVLLAVSMEFLYLGNVVESSTLFFLALAAFCTGVAQREYGILWGWRFWIAAMVLGLILLPQRLYMLTFGAMSLYILLTEMIWKRLCSRGKGSNGLFWVARLVIFNLLYLPLAVGMPGIFLGETLMERAGKLLYPALVLGGQVFLVLYDRAYVYFQSVIWEKIRRGLNL